MTPEQDRDLRRRPCGGSARRLRERRHGGVPVRTRRAAVRLPRGQHATTGRRPRHRADHGLDLVKLQLHVAAGGRLEGDPPRRPAMPSRLGSTARTPSERSPPQERSTSWCSGRPRIRVDTGVAAGDVIPPEYDSMIAKIIAQGRDRDRGAGQAAPGAVPDDGDRAGRTTNKSFLLELLDRAECGPATTTRRGSTG